MIDDQQQDDIGDLISKDINNFYSTSIHNAIVPRPSNQSSQNQEDNQISKYQSFYDFLIGELNRRYDIRPKEGPSRPPKGPIQNEPQIKSIENKTTIIQPLNQTS